MTVRLPVFVLLCSLALPAAVPAAADDPGWRRLLERDGIVTLLATTPPETTADGTRLVRLRRDFSARGDERAYALDQLELDCGRDLYRYREILIYDRDGLLMHRYRLTDQFGPVPADTAVSLARTTACKPANRRTP
jgi:hypothetical protein